MRWVEALDRAAKLAEIRARTGPAGDLARHGRRDQGGHPRARGARGVLRQHYETDALDASTLLAATFGFLPADDRLRKSVEAIADDLTEDGKIRAPLSDPARRTTACPREGSFLICSFWPSFPRWQSSATTSARDLMERLLSVASPLGLYAEEFDTSTGRHLGNFLQAFSHLALIEAAARIVLAERLEEFG